MQLSLRQATRELTPLSPAELPRVYSLATGHDIHTIDVLPDVSAIFLAFHMAKEMHLQRRYANHDLLWEIQIVVLFMVCFRQNQKLRGIPRGWKENCCSIEAKILAGAETPMYTLKQTNRGGMLQTPCHHHTNKVQ